MDTTTPTPATIPVLALPPRYPTAGERHGHETTRVIRRRPNQSGQ